LQNNNVEPLIIAPNLGEIDNYRGSRVIQVDGLPIPVYPELKICTPTINTYREVQAFQPDVAHFIHPIAIGASGMMMAKRMGIPTVASYHLDISSMADHYNVGFLRPLIDYMTKTMFNWADFTLAPSKFVQNEMRGLGLDDVRLWQRGVDARAFHPGFADDAVRNRLSDGHPEDTLLLFVGRLSTEKQIRRLRDILDAVPGTRLAIVGDGPDRDNLHEYFAGTNTVFTGYLRGEELSRAYASADIFTFPSRLETFGLVVVEAMAAGLPVVASRVGGIPDVVQEGVTGYTFDADDTATMIEGVRRIVSSRARLQQMGQAARAFAETKSWDAMMDEVIAHYEKLVTTKRMIQTA
jgi:glycosyltransferase involved in cell wall biosynthesis